MIPTPSPPRERLPDGECHVWVVRLEDAFPAGEDRHRSWLTEEEIQHLRRYRFESHRREHVATRVLARAVLSRYTGVPPAQWIFGAGPHGKPNVTSPEVPLSFNLANTDGLVVCAIAAGGDVGVDVEPVAGRGDPLELAASTFSPDEVVALRATPAADRRARFVALWTLKEAYLKARGLGLALPPDRFSVALEAGSDARITFDPAVQDRSSRWQLVPITAIPGYHLAVALSVGQAGKRQVHVRTSPTLDIY